MNLKVRTVIFAKLVKKTIDSNKILVTAPKDSVTNFGLAGHIIRRYVPINNFVGFETLN